MLRRFIKHPVARCSPCCLSAAPSAQRRHFGPEPIGPAHPDVRWNQSFDYRGRGWMCMYKQLPQDQLCAEGGSTPQNHADRVGWIQDPEDPRHPIMRIQIGEHKGSDGAAITILSGSYGPIRRGSRLLQLCYHHYLEPFSCNRLCVHLRHWTKVPNNHHSFIDWSLEYCGQTSNFIGHCFIAGSCCVMESVTMRADTNNIYVMEGAQILENCCLIADAPTTLHHYQRGELFNPYQTLDIIEGVVKICGNVVLEPNCLVEAAQIGTFTRIGHGTRIMKGAQIGSLSLVLPGSIVLADQKIGDGEIWGGAPAVKIGKVSKFDYKRPYYYSCDHRERVMEGCGEGWTHYGDQYVHREEVMDHLDHLMLTYEKDLPDSLKQQVEDFCDGREPYNHTIARLTQGWTPINTRDAMTTDGCVPAINPTPYRNHNDDSESDYSGTVFNWRKYHAERRW